MVFFERDLLSWAKATVKRYEGSSFLSSGDKEQLELARGILYLIEKYKNLEEKLNKTKSQLSSKNREIEELRSKIAEAEFKELPDVDEPQLVISGDSKALSVLWNLIKNNGWEAYEGTVKDSRLQILSVKDAEGNTHILINRKSGMAVLTLDLEELKEKIGYITPLGQFEREKRKLPKALKDALTKALAQYFELLKVEMKIELFMANILPFARLAGIEVGDPNRVRPFTVWTVSVYNSIGEKIGTKEVPIYTPEQAYRGWVSALNSKNHWGYVGEGDLSLSAITRTLVEFMNYTIQQIAVRYPEVVSEALNLAARSVGKLPTASLVDLGGGKALEETKEVEETD